MKFKATVIMVENLTTNDSVATGGALLGPYPTKDATLSLVPELPDNRHIVIPLMSFVFGFPVLVITLLCIIQQRNRWIMQREIAYLRQTRLSTATTSTVYTGMPLSHGQRGRRASELPQHKKSLPPPYDHTRKQRSHSTAIPYKLSVVKNLSPMASAHVSHSSTSADVRKGSGGCGNIQESPKSTVNGGVKISLEEPPDCYHTATSLMPNPVDQNNPKETDLDQVVSQEE